MTNERLSELALLLLELVQWIWIVYCVREISKH
jgi:hypothetical protein